MLIGKMLFVLTRFLQMNSFAPIFVCIFMMLLKKMCGITNAVAIESYNLREAFSYWKQCQRDYIRRFTQLNQ